MEQEVELWIHLQMNMEIHSIAFFFVLSYCDLLLFPEAY